MANWIGEFDAGSRVDFDVTTVGLDGLPTVLTSGSACIKRSGIGPALYGGPALAWAGVSALTVSGGLLSGTVFTGSASSYFIVGSDYTIYLGYGTISTTSAVGYVLGHFSIGARPSLNMAANLKTFWNVVSGTGTQNSLPAAVAGATTGLPTKNQLSAVTDILSDSTPIAGAQVAAIYTKTQLIPASPASTTNITAVDTVTNLTNAPTAGDLTTTMKASVATAVLTTAITESIAADGAAPTLAQFISMIISKEFEMSIVGSTITCKKLDGSTTAMTFTMNDATSPTSITRTT